MSDDEALLREIISQPDEDTPRLAYADWLDENQPDAMPSPATSPSARAEFIRVQCRLAAGAFDAPDYPELLEREQDLADWIAIHNPDPDLASDTFHQEDPFGTGEWSAYRRGFHEVIAFEDYQETADETVETLAAAMKETFQVTPARTLVLEDASAEEITLFTRHAMFKQLRGLYLDYLIDGDENMAISAVAAAPGAIGLRRLFLDMPLEAEACKALAASKYLMNLESLDIDYPITAQAMKHFQTAKWFCNLRRLHVWGGGDLFRMLADSPPMPRLVSLSVGGAMNPSLATVRRFASSTAFPRLAHLRLTGTHLQPPQIALLAKGRWPLRHLDLQQNEVRKAGCEALAAAPFARTLRVLSVTDCEVTSGGVQALADCDEFAHLQHLSLTGNPIGPSGLSAIAGSQAFQQLRSLDLSRANSPRGPIAARHLYDFLTTLDMPHLQHLRLSNMPVAIRGSRVIATSPTFANLTRLHLDYCSIGSRGTAELLESKNLAGLAYLNITGNKVGSAVSVLTNPKRFPRLGYCLLGTAIPKATIRKLLNRPGMLFQ